MARLPALIDAFVRIDGRDRATIEHVARVIREHGFIPTTKRGSGASAMSSVEAVNLLMALNGAATPKDGPNAVMRLRALMAQPCDLQLAEPLRSLSQIRAFGDALQFLIDRAPQIADFYGKSVEHPSDDFFRSFRIEIRIEFGCASIRLDRNDLFQVGEDFRAVYHLSRESEYAKGGFFDRQVVVYLGARTVFTLWLCIHGDLAQERS